LIKATTSSGILVKVARRVIRRLVNKNSGLHKSLLFTHISLRPIIKNRGLPKMLRWSYTLRSDQNTENSAAGASTLLAPIEIKIGTWGWGFQWVGGGVGVKGTLVCSFGPNCNFVLGLEPSCTKRIILFKEWEKRQSSLLHWK
jgi:hypothetical protein